MTEGAAASLCPTCGTPLPSGVRADFCPACLLQDAAAPTPGGEPVLPVHCRSLGDYDLIEEIARGGMGVVYRARQRSLGRIVAVKLVLGGHFASQEMRERFRNEASVAARLRHPNIVQIHEIGEHEGQLFFSMDFIEGKTLAALVHGEPFGSHPAATCMAKVARAVEYAHAEGTLHRDLKPSNILIDANDVPLITDFGLAKQLQADTELTATGQILGSPAYAAPEQARGASTEVGPASDLYSLGAVLYHLLTARPPFQGDSIGAVLQQVSTDEPIPPRQLNPSIPVDLETICLRCLEKEPARRYATAKELADDLERFLRHEPVQARPVTPLGRLWRWSRRHPGIAGLSATLALALIAGAVGATAAVIQIQKAERRATSSLRSALLEQARTLTYVEQGGHRSEALRLVRESVALGMTEGEKPAARDLVAAILALSECRFVSPEFLPHAPDPDLHFLQLGHAIHLWAIEPERIIAQRLVDGRESSRFQLPQSPANRILGLSPDGDTVLVRHAGAVTCWPREGTQGITFPMPRHGVIGFNPGSEIAALEEPSCGIRVINVISGETLAKLSPPNPEVARFGRGWNALAISSAGNHVAGARSATNWVDILRVSDGGHRHRMITDRPITAVAWSRTGLTLLTGDTDGRVLFWDTTDWKLRTVVPPVSAGVTELTISPNNRLLAVAANDHTIHIIEVASMRRSFHTAGSTHGLHFSPDSTRLGPVFHAGKVGWLEFSRPTEFQEQAAAISPDILDCRFGPDPRFATIRAASRSALILASTGTQLTAIDSVLTEDLRILPDGRSLLGVDPRGVGRWPIEILDDRSANIRRRVSLLEGDRWKSAAASMSGNRFAAADSVTNQALLFEGTWEKAARSFGPHLGVDFVELSPDGHWLITGSTADHRLRVWDADSGQRVLELPGGERPRAVFSPNGKLCAAFGANLFLHAVPTWTAHPATPAVPAAAAAAFSPDSRRIAIASVDSAIALFDTDTGERLVRLVPPRPNRIRAVAFTPDGRRLIAVGDGSNLRIWDLRRLRQSLQEFNLDWEHHALPPETDPESERMRMTFGRPP